MRPQIVRLDTARFTAGNVEKLSLPPGKTDHIEWDPELPGFGVRLRAGSAFYVVQYRIGSKQRRESLGDIRKTELEQARKNARVRFAQVELGIDPRAERDKLEASQKADGLTFKVLCEDYLAARKAVQRASTHNAAKRYFELHWAPLHRRAVHTIDRATVAALLRDITRDHGRTAAARARGNLSALFAWALREGVTASNPVVGTNDPAEGIAPRDRVLTPEELKAIWNQCQDDDFGRIVRLLLLTACRRDEIGGLRWSELDLETGKMLLPKERTKPGRPLALTLPDCARSILKGAPRRAGRDLVFGGGKAGFSAWSYCTLSFNARVTAANGGRALKAWRIHDLRRTVRTGMSEIGVKPHVAELVLNHTGHKAGIGAVYDHYGYEPEIAEALAKWEAHLLAIVGKGA
jgi:integrase